MVRGVYQAMYRTAFVIVSLASVCLGMETLLYGQTDYFPLAQGDIWIYACNGSCGGQATVTVLVGSTMNVKGITYSQLQGWFGGNYWVREDSDGRVWAYDANFAARGFVVRVRNECRQRLFRINSKRVLRPSHAHVDAFSLSGSRREL